MDLAELGLKIDSAPVVDADQALEDFADTAKKAGDAADDFNRGAEETVGAAKKLGDEVKSAEEGFNLLAIGIGAAVTALSTGLVMGITGAIGRIEEETKLLAQFDQVLQNTGNSANTTAEEFAAFADRVEDSTGRAAEEILAVGANLASFGFDNEIFYGAIQLANDMSAAWGGDLRSSLEGLGRALDDPINGFAMLQKRGISLTEEQANMVKSLVDTNKELDAQAYIINILAEQVGGAAEAGFTGFAAAQQRLGKAIEGVFEAIVEGSGLIDILSAGMNAAATAINFVSDNLDALLAILAPVGVALGMAFGPTIIASITAITTAIAGPLISAITAMTVAIMANPLGLLVVGVTAAVATIVYFREQLGLTDERLAAIGAVGARVFNIIAGAVSAMWEAVGPILTAVFERLSLWGGYIIDTLTPAFTAFKDVVVPIFEEIWSWIDRVLTAAEELLGILPQVKEGANDNQQQASASSNMAKDTQAAIEKGGATASKVMESGVKKGGDTASTALAKTGRGWGTALEKVNASGSKQLEAGVKKGGDTAAAAITAAGNIMAAKFEGTGRNIYDLWNNWGDQFIDSFGNSIGKMLVEFQKAQTNLLKAQAAEARARAELLQEQQKRLERGKSMDGSSGGTGGSDSKTSTGSFDFSDPFRRDKSDAEKLIDKYTGTDRKGTELGVISREIINGYPTNDNPRPNRPDERGLTIVNSIDPRDTLTAMNSREGKETIKNVIMQNPDILRQMRG